MQKALTPRQKLEADKLDHAVNEAESEMRKAESSFGKASPQYAVAERQRDEMLAKMQRLTRVLDGPETEPKPPAQRVVTVVKSRRIIRR